MAEKYILMAEKFGLVNINIKITKTKYILY